MPSSQWWYSRFATGHELETGSNNLDNPVHLKRRFSIFHHRPAPTSFSPRPILVCDLLWLSQWSMMRSGARPRNAASRRSAKRGFLKSSMLSLFPWFSTSEPFKPGAELTATSCYLLNSLWWIRVMARHCPHKRPTVQNSNAIMLQPSPNSPEIVNKIFKPLDRAQNEIRLV